MMAVLSGLAVLVEVTSERRRRRCDGLASVDVEVGREQQQYSTRQTDESKRGEDLSNLPDWSLLQGPTCPTAAHFRPMTGRPVPPLPTGHWLDWPDYACNLDF